jgi:DNA-binding SARP family transcriptional activator
VIQTCGSREDAVVSREGLREPDQKSFDRARVAAMVLEHSPTAVVVQDAEGRVVTANAAAGRMLGAMVPLRRGAPLGCRVLGCRARGTHLADVCVHELARRQGEPLPPLRVELPVGSPVGVVSATLVALEHGLTVTELRGDGGQLAAWARSSAPAAEPHLRLFVLGRTRIMNGDAAREGRWTGNRAGHILKLLVAERHRDLPSDEIITTLWPPDSSPDARGVRYFVRQLRHHLEPDGATDPPSSFVAATRSGYALHRARVWIDADVFEQLVTEGCAAAGRDDDRARDLLRDGVAMYRGDFLADEPYAEWALPERDRLRDLMGRALRTLAEIELRRGELADATSALVRLGELEPFDLDLHRELFALLLRRGRRSETHRRYETLRRRMLATFDERLDFSLSQLT